MSREYLECKTCGRGVTIVLDRNTELPATPVAKLKSEREMCASCLIANGLLKRNASGELELVPTTTSSSSTDTPESPKSSSRRLRGPGNFPDRGMTVLDREAFGPLPNTIDLALVALPVAVVVLLLEAVGGSLTMTIDDLSRERTHPKIQSDWVRYDNQDTVVLETRLVDP